MSPERRDELVALLGGVLMLGLVAAVVVPQTVLTEDARSTTADPAGDVAIAEAPTVTPSPSPFSPSDPEPIPAAATTTGGVLVMWARGGLPAELTAAAADLPGVDSVAFVRSGTLGLIGARDASGAERVQLGDGRRIPVAAVAVEPGAWRSVVGPDPDGGPGVTALEPGTVILSRTGADLRGIGVGGVIDLETLAALEVAAVVADEHVRGAELLLHADDAETAGIRGRGSLVVRFDEDGVEDVLAARLEELVPVGTSAQVVPGGTAGYRAPLVLPLPEVKAAFGEFWYRPRVGERGVDIDPAFVAANIVWADVPILGEVRCHRAVVDDLRAALGEIVHGGLADSIDPEGYAGCFNARHISVDGDALSRHSWGIALDINVDLSLPGLGEVPPLEVIEAFGRHGFRWGGDFLHPDNHHFEWVGPSASERPSASR